MRLVCATAAASALLSGCAAAPPPIAPPAVPVSTEREFSNEPHALLRFHSARFRLSVPLPDGRAWRIDDHGQRALVARHEPTRSTLTLLVFNEPDLMNRKKCEARAVEMGLLDLIDPHVIEDQTTIGPDAFDSRVWTAVETRGSPGTALAGHALLVGAYIRKCLFVHYATGVARLTDEPVLTGRLAMARIRILGGLQMEPFDAPPRQPEAP